MAPWEEAAESPVPLPGSFFQPSASVVAPRLLGHRLLRRTPEGTWAGGEIVETEAYLANDPACHGFRGETARNRSMFGPAGRAYVYFIYGHYFCFNVVCARPGVAEAVLVRAIEPSFGRPWMLQNRPVKLQRALTSGPAKLCLALAIKRPIDGVELNSSASEIILARNPARRNFVRARGPLLSTTRIGISTAADLPLRFLLAGSEFISRSA